jgi:hypothetical protein
MKLSLIVALAACLAFTALGAQTKKTNQSKKTEAPTAGPTIKSFTPSVKILATCPDLDWPYVYVARCGKNPRTTVTLTVEAAAEQNPPLTYTYSVTVGQIVGEGSQVTWSFGKAMGEHTATVTVRDSRGREAKATTTVLHTHCSSCVIPDPPCAAVNVTSREEVAHRAERAVFEVEMSSGNYFLERPDYVWTVTGGKILKGQHTPSVEVLVTGDIHTSITATVEVSGFDPSCTARAATHSLSIEP